MLARRRLRCEPEALALPLAPSWLTKKLARNLSLSNLLRNSDADTRLDRLLPIGTVEGA